MFLESYIYHWRMLVTSLSGARKIRTFIAVHSMSPCSDVSGLDWAC
jgi:hypothetical protein